MRITESQLKRMIRKTINEMADDGMGSVSMQRPQRHVEFLISIALCCRDAGFKDLLCKEIGDDLCKQLMTILEQIRVENTYGG